MIQGFQSRYVEAVCDQNGREWKLLTPIVYRSRDGRTFIVPRGANTDGASTPAIIASVLPPTGDYWQSAVLHDSLYQNTARLWQGEGEPSDLSPATVAGLPKAALSKSDCDLMLKEAMTLSGVNPETVQAIYTGVEIGGAFAFKEDRA